MSYQVDLDEIMCELCEECESKKVHPARHHDRGWDEPYATCPAGEVGEGSIEYQDGEFWCRQAGN